MVAVRFCPRLFRLQNTAPAPGAVDSKQQPHEQGACAGHHCSDTAGKQESTTQQQPFQLPYRMLFAIATLDSIIVYDTQVRNTSALYASLHHDCKSMPTDFVSHIGNHARKDGTL